MPNASSALAIVCIPLLFAACATTDRASAPSASAATGSGKRVEVTATSLNVRQLPHTDGAIVDKLERGERVNAPRQASEGWLFVETDSGVSGYVSEKYVRPVPEDSAATPAAAPAERPAESAAAKPDYTPAPGSKLARVTPGMSSGEVVEILGEPTSQQNYITGKAFIPYYYGSDTNRVDFKYEGLGRVVLTRNRYSGSLKVVRVEADASESGH